MKEIHRTSGKDYSVVYYALGMKRAKIEVNFEREPEDADDDVRNTVTGSLQIWEGGWEHVIRFAEKKGKRSIKDALKSHEGSLLEFAIKFIDGVD